MQPGGSFWLIVERLENWESDQREGFRSFGLPESRRKSAEKMRPGDIVFVYVSTNVSSLSDIRRVTAGPTSFPRSFAKYGQPYAIQIRTESVLVLDRKAWVPLRGLVDKLSFTKEKASWAGLVRHALRRLDQTDAALMAEALVAAKGASGRHVLSEVRRLAQQGT